MPRPARSRTSRATALLPLPEFPRRTTSAVLRPSRWTRHHRIPHLACRSPRRDHAASRDMHTIGKLACNRCLCSPVTHRCLHCQGSPVPSRIDPWPTEPRTGHNEFTRQSFAGVLAPMSMARSGTVLPPASLHPGERLSDLRLSRELGVSRTPVREALHRLVQDGVVDYYPNRGFFVATFSGSRCRRDLRSSRGAGNPCPAHDGRSVSPGRHQRAGRSPRTCRRHACPPPATAGCQRGSYRLPRNGPGVSPMDHRWLRQPSADQP